MEEEGVTVAEAMEGLQDYDYLMELRRVTFDQLAVYERRLGMRVTTSDKLFWLKKRGPSEEIIFRQVQHIRSCERS